MEKGYSFATKIIKNSLTEEELLEIEELVLENKNISLVTPSFEEELSSYCDNRTEKDNLTIRRYTGYDFININAILRDNWTYDKNGKFSIEKRKELVEYADSFSNLIKEFPETKNPFMTYRGTTIEEFKKYNISSLEELINLKGKLLYEEGFTSTSLDEEKSYYNKEINNSVKNIEIRYIIPSGSQDGMPLVKQEFSYSTSQNEYVLDRNTLSKVLDVNIEENNAVITIVLIPKKI